MEQKKIKKALVEQIKELCERENDISLLDLIYQLLATNIGKEETVCAKTEKYGKP